VGCFVISRVGREPDWCVAPGSVEQTHAHMLASSIYITRDIPYGAIKKI